MFKRTRNMCIAIIMPCTSLNASEQHLSPGMQEVNNMIFHRGFIDNKIIAHICSSGKGEVIQSHDDYNALNGLPVIIKFTVISYSKSKKELHGKFFGRAGSWGEDIYVTAFIDNGSAIKKMKSGSSISASGSMMRNGNDFYGNAIDSCFIQFNSKKFEVDRF